MQVRIYKPAKTAMQSGQRNTKEWVLESEPAAQGDRPADGLDQLAGHHAAGEAPVPTLEEAKAYAEKNGWHYTVELPNARHVRPKAYADNFAYNRVGRWTH